MLNHRAVAVHGNGHQTVQLCTLGHVQQVLECLAESVHAEVAEVGQHGGRQAEHAGQEVGHRQRHHIPEVLRLVFLLQLADEHEDEHVCDDDEENGGDLQGQEHVDHRA